MEVDPAFGKTPDALEQIRVRSSGGDLVPLSAFARWGPSTAPLQINHQAQFPSVTISFNLPPGVALGDAVAAVESAEREMGLPASVRGSFSGTAQAFQDSLRASRSDRRGAADGLPGARHPLREPDPPAHDPLDAAFGGSRGAPRTAFSSRRSCR
jgi:hypothetical protein